jgi:hypothetical protein
MLTHPAAYQAVDLIFSLVASRVRAILLAEVDYDAMGETAARSQSDRDVFQNVG